MRTDKDIQYQSFFQRVYFSGESNFSVQLNLSIRQYVTKYRKFSNKNSDHDGTKPVQDVEKHFEVEIWDFYSKNQKNIFYQSKTRAFLKIPSCLFVYRVVCLFV